jgi:cation diffusion facilitator family transporter
MNDLREFDEDENHPERVQAAQRSTWVSVAVNLVLTAIQMVVGLWAGSQALIADGVHSMSDLASDFVVLLALRHSKKEADADHPYGHQRYENAASLVLGALLLVVGLGMVWAAVAKLSNPASIGTVSGVALWVVLGTLVAKEALFRYMLRVAQRVRSSLLVANAWHARSDAASSLVVAVGIGGNMLGFGLLDPIAATLVGFMVGKMGWDFLWNALHDLTDRAASEEETQRIHEELLRVPGIRGIHDLRTRKTGDMLLVDVHLEVDGALSVAQGHAIALEARKQVMDKHRVLGVMTHVDPV